ncbi:MAG: uroporphyrinogen-III synthase [Bacteroidota bacterium]
MRRVLSTKIVSAAQQEQIRLAGFDLVAYNAISTQPIKPAKKLENFKASNAIVTSQRTVELIKKLKINIERAFCVGKKTAQALEKLSVQVVEFTNYGKDLAELIATNYSDLQFDFFCGKQRRDSIPTILNAASVDFNEHHLYETKIQPKKWDKDFDAILFFSPSAVESFFQLNTVKNSQLICIGKTTASAAQKYSSAIRIAKTTSIESCIAELKNV